MSIKKAIMPTLVLMIICIFISGALVLVNNATKDAIEETNRKTLNDTLVSAFGEGEYTQTDKSFDGIDSVINGEDGLVVYEITTDGYSSGGIHVLVGIKDGEVAGVSFISCGETPGLGTKVNNEAFLEKYTGLKDEDEVTNADAVTGATFSSNGLKTAVKLALSADKEA